MSADREKLLDLIDQVKLVACDGQGPKGLVYFIMCTDSRRCKIGFTTGKVEKRLASLQTGSASQLAAVLMHPGTIESERRLHEKFASSRIHGEWFELTDELRAYMVAALWAMSEITLKGGGKLQHWMVKGLELSLDHLEALPESLIELLEAEPT